MTVLPGFVPGGACGHRGGQETRGASPEARRILFEATCAEGRDPALQAFFHGASAGIPAHEQEGQERELDRDVVGRLDAACAEREVGPGEEMLHLAAGA